MTQALEAMLDEMAVFVLWIECRDYAGWPDEFILDGASGAVREAVGRLRSSGSLKPRLTPEEQLERFYYFNPEERPQPPPRRVRDRDRARSAETASAVVLQLKVCSKCGTTEASPGEFPVHGRQRFVCMPCDAQVRAVRAEKLRASKRPPGVAEDHKLCQGYGEDGPHVAPLEDFTWWVKSEGRRGPRCRYHDCARQRDLHAARKAAAAE
jgi:hypothetical protein